MNTCSVSAGVFWLGTSAQNAPFAVLYHTLTAPTVVGSNVFTAGYRTPAVFTTCTTIARPVHECAGKLPERNHAPSMVSGYPPAESGTSRLPACCTINPRMWAALVAKASIRATSLVLLITGTTSAARMPRIATMIISSIKVNARPIDLDHAIWID